MVVGVLGKERRKRKGGEEEELPVPGSLFCSSSSARGLVTPSNVYLRSGRYGRVYGSEKGWYWRQERKEGEGRMRWEEWAGSDVMVGA